MEISNKPCSLQEVYESAQEVYYRLKAKLENSELNATIEDNDYLRRRIQHIEQYLNNNSFCKTK